METYTNYDMCKECGGVCCLASGCAYLPQDFESMDFEYLKEKIEEGNITICGSLFGKFANYTAWSFFMYLKISNFGEKNVNFIGGTAPCSLYTPDGCPLTLEERPSYAKTVKPTKVGGPCEQTMPHEEFREAWAKHFDVLAQLVKYFTNKDAIELFKEELILKDHTYESLKMLPFYYPQYSLNMGPKLIRKKDGEQY